MDYIDFEPVLFNIFQAVVQAGEVTGYEGGVNVMVSSDQFDRSVRGFYQSTPIVPLWLHLPTHNPPLYVLGHGN